MFLNFFKRSSVTINGKRIRTNGSNIVVSNGRVFIDGKEETRGKSIKGNGIRKTRLYEVNSFNEIVVSEFEIEYRQAKAYQVSIDADENILDIINVRVEDSVLWMDTNDSYTTNNRIKVVVSGPRLNNVKIAGSSNFISSSVLTDNLQIDVKGSGDVLITEGRTSHLYVNITGSGNVKMSDLRSIDSRLSIMGSGDIRAYCSNNCQASIMGSGDIRVFGNPQKLQKSVLGSGRIREM